MQSQGELSELACQLTLIVDFAVTHLEYRWGLHHLSFFSLWLPCSSSHFSRQLKSLPKKIPPTSQTSDTLNTLVPFQTKYTFAAALPTMRCWWWAGLGLAPRGKPSLSSRWFRTKLFSPIRIVSNRPSLTWVWRECFNKVVKHMFLHLVYLGSCLFFWGWRHQHSIKWLLNEGITLTTINII